MRPQRKPEEIFSLSFLDVIACAVGVVLFITILAISNTVSQGDPELMRELEESMSMEATLDRMQDQLQDNQSKQAEMEEAKKKLASLQASIATIGNQTALSEQYAQLREQYDAAKAELEQTAALSQAMPNRSPVARSTNKKPIVYLSFAGNGTVRIAKQVSGEFSSDYYTVMDTGTEVILEAKGPPASIEEIINSGGGKLAESLAGLDQARHYIECYVESDAFEDFIKMRAWLQSKGWDVGYLFNTDTSRLLYGYTGRTSKVQ